MIYVVSFFVRIIVFGFVFSVPTNRFAGKSICNITYFVSNGA